MTNTEMDAVIAIHKLNSAWHYLLWREDYDRDNVHARQILLNLRDSFLGELPFGESFDTFIRDTVGRSFNEKWRIISKAHPEWFGGK